MVLLITYLKKVELYSIYIQVLHVTFFGNMGNLTHCKIFVHVDIRMEWAQQCISNNKYFQHQENQREEKNKK